MKTMKKLLTLIAILATTVAMAAAPKCVVKSEFWGRKYLELTDVNGVVYKVTPPSAGITVRFVGKTGWYELTNDGKIVRWKDPK